MKSNENKHKNHHSILIYYHRPAEICFLDKTRVILQVPIIGNPTSEETLPGTIVPGGSGSTVDDMSRFHSSLLNSG